MFDTAQRDLSLDVLGVPRGHIRDFVIIAGEDLNLYGRYFCHGGMRSTASFPRIYYMSYMYTRAFVLDKCQKSLHASLALEFQFYQCLNQE